MCHLSFHSAPCELPDSHNLYAFQYASRSRRPTTSSQLTSLIASRLNTSCGPRPATKIRRGIRFMETPGKLIKYHQLARPEYRASLTGMQSGKLGGRNLPNQWTCNRCCKMSACVGLAGRPRTHIVPRSAQRPRRPRACFPSETAPLFCPAEIDLIGHDTAPGCRGVSGSSLCGQRSINDEHIDNTHARMHTQLALP